MATEVVYMNAFRPLSRANKIVLRSTPLDLLGKRVGKGVHEIKPHSWTRQSANPTSELVQVRVGKSSLQEVTSSGKLGLVRLKLSGAAAELLEERDRSSSVEKMVSIGDHGRNVLNFHDSTLVRAP